LREPGRCRAPRRGSGPPRRAARGCRPACPADRAGPDLGGGGGSRRSRPDRRQADRRQDRPRKRHRHAPPRRPPRGAAISRSLHRPGGAGDRRHRPQAIRAGTEVRGLLKRWPRDDASPGRPFDPEPVLAGPRRRRRQGSASASSASTSSWGPADRRLSTSTPSPASGACRERPRSLPATSLSSPNRRRDPSASRHHRPPGGLLEGQLRLRGSRPVSILRNLPSFTMGGAGLRARRLPEPELRQSSLLPLEHLELSNLQPRRPRPARECGARDRSPVRPP
jgi:hypothetical protein